MKFGLGAGCPQRRRDGMSQRPHFSFEVSLSLSSLEHNEGLVTTSTSHGHAMNQEEAPTVAALFVVTFDQKVG